MTERTVKIRAELSPEVKEAFRSMSEAATQHLVRRPDDKHYIEIVDKAIAIIVRSLGIEEGKPACTHDRYSMQGGHF